MGPERPRLVVVLLAVLLLLRASTAPADVVTIEPSGDATILSEDDRKANGSGAYFFAGNTDQGDQRRALIRFDMAGNLPAGATINSVSLQLHVSRSAVAGDRTVELHRVLTDWTEGPSNPGGQEGGGDSAELGDVTWRYTSYDPDDEPGSPQWGSLGGDFAAAVSAAITVGGVGFYTWSSAQMAADVQGWVDSPSTDFGWLLKDVSDGGTGTAKRYDSRQNNDASERPKLTIDFTPQAATGACCNGASCAVLTGAQCGGTFLAGGTCSPSPCTAGCCLPNASASCIETDETTCTAQGGGYQSGLLCAASACPVVLTPFVDALPIPGVAQPVGTDPDGALRYEMSMREVQQLLHGELPFTTTVWGFGDGPTGATYPGPTLEATVDQPVRVVWKNDLRDTAATGDPLRQSHYLTIDDCPHGVPPPPDDQSVRTVVHLHGGHVSAESDGYPEHTFLPGEQVTYEYPNDQLPGTLWYHDHALGITRLNVYMGLAGFYILRDALEDSLGLPACDGACTPGAPREYDIPLAIQDRTFEPDSALYYPGVWEDVFFGDKVLVNGKVWPFLNVKRGKYRFRVLNGSTSRTYALTLDNGADFVQIGAEGGLLPAPVTVSELRLGPGERADVVLDFEPYAAGTEILLVNSAPAPFPGDPGTGVVPDVMKFVVQSPLGHTDQIPGSLRPLEVLKEADATVTRDFDLDKGPGDACSPFIWEIVSTAINGIPVTAPNSRWDDVTEFPQLGTTEIWRFANKSGMTHPMHMHLVMFQVLDRQPCAIDANDVCVPQGSPTPPPPEEAGWKDTVQVGPNEIVRVIARFTNPLDPTGTTYVGEFSYHCHILEHEDHEMMRQFVSETTCGDGIPGLPQEECDDGGTAPGDGCSPSCQIEECANGVDDDGDGFVDFVGGDPGCDTAADLSEKSPSLICDDGMNNDTDAFVDYPDDPGCASPTWPFEDPKCQDGINNDPAQDLLIDFDGGASAGVPPAQQTAPDPQCTFSSQNRERRRTCGLGIELTLLLPLLLWLRGLGRRGRRYAAVARLSR